VVAAGVAGPRPSGATEKQAASKEARERRLRCLFIMILLS
jgi:hypothetical protein